MNAFRDALHNWTCSLYFVCLFATYATVALALRRARPWRHAEFRRTAGVLLALVCVGFVLRRFLDAPVLLDWPLRMPSPGRCGEPRNGPGYSLFANLCFLVGGASEASVILGNILVGTFTAVPVFLLVRLSTGRVQPAIASGIALALLQPHVRMSNANDAAVWTGFHVVEAFALVEAARVTGIAEFVAAACLAAALAAMTRPEVVPVFAVVIALLATDRDLRRLLVRPGVLVAALGASCAVATIILDVFRHREGQPLALGPRALAEVLFAGLTRCLLILPPSAPVIVGALWILGMVIAVRESGRRAAFWVIAGLLPVLGSARDLGSTVTEKHQISLLVIGSAFVGIGASWLVERVASKAPATRARWVRALAFAGGITVLGFWLSRPAPLPTFALEYRFFVRNLDRIPDQCTVLYPRTPSGNGLETPTRVSDLHGRRFRWLPFSQDIDASAGCVMYWKPAACHHGVLPDRWFPWLALPADFGWVDDRRDGDSALGPPRDCFVAERAFELEPFATTVLPARLGHRGAFRSDAVPIGFYRVHPRRHP